jgi:NADH-quinone oxidoreductase subunit N
MMFLGAFFSQRQVIKYIAAMLMGINLFTAAIEMLSKQALFMIDKKGSLLATDPFNLTFITLIIFCALIYILLSGKAIEKVGNQVAEYYALIFFIMCGISIAVTYKTLLMLFLGIEIVSIPLYILTASDKRNLKSNEAALKYFLMGSFSTGIMLLGIAFIYGGSATGTFHIDQLNLGAGMLSGWMALGLVLMLISLSFKVSAAPFHFWTPDVYDGAPTVFTSFMSTLVKAAFFVAFIRLFEHSFGAVQDQWQKLIVVLIVATLLIGNLTAVFQQSVKRMLAYSSIAQAGFMLFAIFAMNDKAKEGLLLYSVAYTIATVGLFGVLTKMDDYTVEGFNGLAKKNPVLAFSATVFLLSLTGVPLTAGFQSKFFMLMAAVQNGHHIWLVIMAVLFAAVSAYYYFRVIQAMYFKEALHAEIPDSMQKDKAFESVLIGMVILTLLIGIYPEIIIGWMYR